MTENIEEAWPEIQPGTVPNPTGTPAEITPGVLPAQLTVDELYLDLIQRLQFIAAVSKLTSFKPNFKLIVVGIPGRSPTYESEFHLGLEACLRDLSQQFEDIGVARVRDLEREVNTTRATLQAMEAALEMCRKRQQGLPNTGEKK